MAKVDLPDFDELLALAEKIAKFNTALIVTNSKKDQIIAEITKKVTEDHEYWRNGKAPSMEYVKSVYQHIGYNDDLKASLESLNNEIAKLTYELELSKNKFIIYREMINVWRTLSANERTATL